MIVRKGGDITGVNTLHNTDMLTGQWWWWQWCCHSNKWLIKLLSKYTNSESTQTTYLLDLDIMFTINTLPLRWIKIPSFSYFNKLKERNVFMLMLDGLSLDNFVVYFSASNLPLYLSPLNNNAIWCNVLLVHSMYSIVQKSR